VVRIPFAPSEVFGEIFRFPETGNWPEEQFESGGGEFVMGMASRYNVREVKMGIQQLTAISQPSGDVEFSCPKCHQLARPAFGSGDKGNVAYLMVCSGCGIVLGEWATAEERAKDLSELAAKAKEGLAI
jgi:hypothetical protein